MEKFSYKDAKILVVDDVEEVLTSTRNCLRLQGMQVDCINNPLEALEYLKKNNVDVLLLDFFMPEMNGDEFIKELRKFDNETVVILRTGYSDKVPPLEIIDELNIQGYIDKIKGKDELILLTKSAIKTSFLNKTIKQQEKEIEEQQYRNEFFGKFLYRFIGEVRERTFIIDGLIDDIISENQENSLEDRKRYIQSVKEASERLMEIVKTLEIEKISIFTISMLQNILNCLFEIDLKINNSKLTFKYNNEYMPLECEPKMLIYILVDIIEYLLHSKAQEIIIDCVQQENITVIKICNSISNPTLIKKIEKLAELDLGISLKNDNNNIAIQINNK